jgi:hypothetical protein
MEAGGMNKAVVRGLCLIALVVSIAVRVQSNRAREAVMTDFDVGAAITDVIREHGYALRENPVKPPKLLAAAIYFQRPECEQASFVLPYFINAETMSMLTRLNKPDFARRFFYLDGAWDEQSRVAMFLEWAKYAVLDIFGASPYVPVKKAIILAEPPDCRSPAPIDWRPVWDKDRYRKSVNAGIARHAGT